MTNHAVVQICTYLKKTMSQKAKQNASGAPELYVY